MEDILPFISEAQLEKIAEQEYEGNGLWNFAVMTPFLDSEMLSEFVKEEYLK